MVTALNQPSISVNDIDASFRLGLLLRMHPGRDGQVATK